MNNIPELDRALERAILNRANAGLPAGSPAACAVAKGVVCIDAALDNGDRIPVILAVGSRYSWDVAAMANLAARSLDPRR